MQTELYKTNAFNFSCSNLENNCFMSRLDTSSKAEASDDVGGSMLEPTPIGPNGMIPVQQRLSWQNDYPCFLASLQEHLSNEDRSAAFHTKTLAATQQGSSFSVPVSLEDMVLMNACKQRAAGKESDSYSTASTASLTSQSEQASYNAPEAVFRSNQLEQWNQRYHELVEFRQQHGHCLVPLSWPSNPSLAHWVKRQRHQYRMKQEGKHSTLTPDREEALSILGFVWDSHAAGWDERWKELRAYREEHGHCRVPKKYPENPQLAVWVKCQRRQFKLYTEGRDSNMTRERIEKLLSLGFVFLPRLQRNKILF